MTLDQTQIRALLTPYIVDSIDDVVVNQLGSYLDLLMKWNTRVNVTSIREPEEIIRTHFGESLFAAQHLSGPTLLDFGSGGGFPGIPIQLYRPQMAVTLSESQNRKASFLREVVRVLALPTAVHAARVETMPATERFSIVTLRAVDNMEAALTAALPRLESTGTLAILTTLTQQAAVIAATPGIHWADPIPVPQSQQKILLLGRIPVRYLEL